MNLEDLGWTPDIDTHLQSHEFAPLIPGRVSSLSGKHYRVITGTDELAATLDRTLVNNAQSRSDLPAVGDWVGLKKDRQLNRHLIVALAPRKNRLSRMSAGDRTEEQLIASNIDTVFIVTGLDRDFNIRRIERYLAMVLDMDARPVIILNKTDLCTDAGVYLDNVIESAPDVPVIPISALEGDNVPQLGEYLQPGETVVLVGSSGAGKSTLINQLLGYPRQKVGEVRGSNSRGRHVTTTRELVLLPDGGVLIDNPGLREIQLWAEGHGIAAAFQDIEDLGRHCHFKDCRHKEEPRCKVKQAVVDGVLTEGRLHNYHKLLREHKHALTKRNAHEARKKGKEFAKMTGYAKYKRRTRGGK